MSKGIRKSRKIVRDKNNKGTIFLRGTEPAHALKVTTRRRHIIYIKSEEQSP
jgi:hypothetical protein